MTERKLERVQVWCGDIGPYDALADTSERWNGWLAYPLFTRSEVERIMADVNQDGYAQMTIDADGVWMWESDYAPEYADKRGDLHRFDADGLVCVGGCSWTWLEEDA